MNFKKKRNKVLTYGAMFCLFTSLLHGMDKHEDVSEADCSVEDCLRNEHLHQEETPQNELFYYEIDDDDFQQFENTCLLNQSIFKEDTLYPWNRNKNSLVQNSGMSQQHDDLNKPSSNEEQEEVYDNVHPKVIQALMNDFQNKTKKNKKTALNNKKTSSNEKRTVQVTIDKKKCKVSISKKKSTEWDSSYIDGPTAAGLLQEKIDGILEHIRTAEDYYQGREEKLVTPKIFFEMMGFAFQINEDINSKKRFSEILNYFGAKEYIKKNTSSTRRSIVINNMFSFLSSDSNNQDKKEYYKVFSDFFSEVDYSYNNSKREKYVTYTGNFQYLSNVLKAHPQISILRENIENKYCKEKKIKYCKEKKIKFLGAEVTKEELQGILDKRIDILMDAMEEAKNFDPDAKIVTPKIFFQMIQIALSLNLGKFCKKDLYSNIIEHFNFSETDIRETCYSSKIPKMLKFLIFNQRGGEVKNHYNLFNNFFNDIKKIVNKRNNICKLQNKDLYKNHYTAVKNFVEDKLKKKLEDRFKIILGDSVPEPWYSPKTPKDRARPSFKKDLTEVLSLVEREGVMNYDIFFKIFSLALGVERTSEEKQSTLGTIIDYFKSKDWFKIKSCEIDELKHISGHYRKIVKILKICNTKDFTPQDEVDVTASGNTADEKKDLQIFYDFFQHMCSCSKNSINFFYNTVKGEINDILGEIKNSGDFENVDFPFFAYKASDKNKEGEEAEKIPSKAKKTEDKKTESKKRTRKEIDATDINTVEALNKGTDSDEDTSKKPNTNNRKREAKSLKKEQENIAVMHEKTADLGQTKMMDRLENNGNLNNPTHGPSEFYDSPRDPRVDYTKEEPKTKGEQEKKKDQQNQENYDSYDLAYTITVGSTIDAKKTEGKNKTNTLGHQKFIDEDY